MGVIQINLDPVVSRSEFYTFFYSFLNLLSTKSLYMHFLFTPFISKLIMNTRFWIVLQGGSSHIHHSTKPEHFPQPAFLGSKFLPKMKNSSNAVMKKFANDGHTHSSILRSKRKKKYVFGFNVRTININLFCRKDNGTFLRKTFFYFSPCVIVLELILVCCLWVHILVFFFPFLINLITCKVSHETFCSIFKLYTVQKLDTMEWTPSILPDGYTSTINP